MRRKTAGASRIPLRVLFTFCAASILFAWAAPKQSDYAVVAGTVFSESGLSFPGAEVVITASVPPAGMKPPKPQNAISDRRGEFAFRVPQAKAQYTVSVRAKGYTPEQKMVETSGGPERLDVFFQLKPKP
jgi:hypothetical protein